jgi:hypothetical protein
LAGLHARGHLGCRPLGLRWPIDGCGGGGFWIFRRGGCVGLLSSIMAIGTVSGALLGARRERPPFSLLLIGAAVFGIGCSLAAIAPSHWFFAAALVAWITGERK